MSDPSALPLVLPAATARRDDPSRRVLWVDRLKGLAILWILLNHGSELIWGGPHIGNPGVGWPPFSERLSQLLPLNGDGLWSLPLNVFRYVGWLGDQAIALFLIASGFSLVASLQKRRSSEKVHWREFYARRLWRLYPLWWAVHLLLLLKWLTGRL
ncbi:MAG TPA: acyltransferase family protein, partial [Planctomycetota bacterium]|nr:acyltransferase family protein [Planctomycetota bacterium]